MIEQLEMRIDNVVYKLGFAPTRRSARQMVSHGHIQINGTRTTVPSHMVREGDVIAVRERTKELPIMERVKIGVEEVALPNWLSFNLKKFEAKVEGKPNFENNEITGSVYTILMFLNR